ncbi:MAG TPA: hypothetical protein VFA21_20345 [Pyrinomonadaceae bacterium]|nr:hypothetical protein [Pyrinomonadaceae bacterium]
MKGEPMQQPLIAYHGNPAIKEQYLARVREHREADKLIQGYGYWKNGKGCAVGCTIHSDDHYAYETELGIPVYLARLEDGIFEALPNELAQAWPEAFLEAIPVGTNLYIPYWQFMVWLLIDSEEGVIKFARSKRTRAVIEAVGALYNRLLAGEEVSRQEWRDAADAASAAYAAYAAYAASAASAAYAAARQRARIRQSEKLLELLRLAPTAPATSSAPAAEAA